MINSCNKITTSTDVFEFIMFLIWEKQPKSFCERLLVEDQASKINPIQRIQAGLSGGSCVPSIPLNEANLKL